MSEQVNANIYMVSWVITNQRDKCCSQRCLTQPDTSATFLSKPSSLLFLSELHKPPKKNIQRSHMTTYVEIILSSSFSFAFNSLSLKGSSNHHIPNTIDLLSTRSVDFASWQLVEMELRL